MGKKLLVLDAYGVSEMSGAEMREANGGMTFQAQVKAMMTPEQYDAVVATSQAHAGFVVGFIRGLFGF